LDLKVISKLGSKNSSLSKARAAAKERKITISTRQGPAGGFQVRKIRLSDKGLANKWAIRAEDHAVKMGTGKGLVIWKSKLRKDRRGRPLFVPGERRYFEPIENFPPALQAVSQGRSVLSCVRNGQTGEKRVESAAFFEDRSAVRSEIDSGSVGLPTELFKFLEEDHQLDGVWSLDLSHQRHNGMGDTLTANRVGFLRTEGLLVLNSAGGPFGTGVNYYHLQQSLEEYFNNHTFRDGMWQSWYPLIDKDLNGGTHSVAFGSDEHCEELYDHVRDNSILTRGLSEAAKKNRFYALTMRLREALPGWSVLGFALANMNLHEDWTDQLVPPQDERPGARASVAWSGTAPTRVRISMMRLATGEARSTWNRRFEISTDEALRTRRRTTSIRTLCVVLPGAVITSPTRVRRLWRWRTKWCLPERTVQPSFGSPTCICPSKLSIPSPIRRPRRTRRPWIGT